MGTGNQIEGKFGQAKNAYGLNCIPARRKDTSGSSIHAIFLVMNLIALLPKLPDLSGSFCAILPRPLRYAQHIHTDHAPRSSGPHAHANRSWQIEHLARSST